MFQRFVLTLALSLASFGLIAPAAAGELRYLGSTQLVGVPELGGLSAIEVTKGGEHMLLLSDRAQLFGLEFEMVNGRRVMSLARALDGVEPGGDSEGLAMTDQGPFVSYEGPAHIALLGEPPAPSAPSFAQMKANRSLEALAVDNKQRLYTLPENPPPNETFFPIYRLEDDGWRVITRYGGRKSFLPVGADFGPDGRLYILERSVTLLGFRSRVIAISFENGAPIAEVLLVTPPGFHGNLEGIAVWMSEAGATCVTMVSDNNYLKVLKSELVEYAMSPNPAASESCRTYFADS